MHSLKNISIKSYYKWRKLVLLPRKDAEAETWRALFPILASKSRILRLDLKTKGMLKVMRQVSPGVDGQSTRSTLVASSIPFGMLTCA
jgi:hypothetical protein